MTSVTCDHLISPHSLPDKSAITQLIGTFFSKEWPTVLPDQLTVRTVEHGYSSLILIVQRTLAAQDAAPAEPSKLVIRLPYEGRRSQNPANDLRASIADEIHACQIFASKGWGARVYGVFDGGRIDEFIDGHTLTPAEAEDPLIRAHVAKAYARFHSLSLPFDQSRTQVFNDRVAELLASLANNDLIGNAGLKHDVVVGNILIYRYVDQWNELLTALERSGSDRCWCVIDPQHGNVLVRDKAGDGESPVVLIDFEFVTHHFGAWDIGGHFMEKEFRWNLITEDTETWEVVEGEEVRPYTDEERRHFITEYLEESERLGKRSTREREQEVQHLMYATESGFKMRILFCLACCAEHVQRLGSPNKAFLLLMVKLHTILTRDAVWNQ